MSEGGAIAAIAVIMLFLWRHERRKLCVMLQERRNTDTSVATPVDAPFLTHWAGWYDRVFIALHSFTGNLPEDASIIDEMNSPATPWSMVAKQIPNATFDDFSVAIMLADYGMSASMRKPDIKPRPTDRLIRAIREIVEREGLGYPADDYVSPHFFSDAAEIFSLLDCEEVILWDEFRERNMIASVSDLSSGAFLRDWSGRPPAAISEPDRRVLFDCSFGSMDHMWTAIAYRIEVEDVVRPLERFEGFQANERTTPNWVNEPGTYEAPTKWP